MLSSRVRMMEEYEDHAQKISNQMQYVPQNLPQGCKEKAGLTPGVENEVIVKTYINQGPSYSMCVVVTLDCVWSYCYIIPYFTIFFSAGLYTCLL